MEKYILISLVGMFLAGCSYPLSLVGVDPDSTSSALTDWNEQSVDLELQSAALKILATNCSSCHGEGGGPAGVHSLHNVKQMISSGLIVPKNPNASRLFTVIQANVMPPGNPLSQADKETLRDWILGGSSSAVGDPGQGPTIPTPPPVVIPDPSAPPEEAAALTILAQKCAGCHGATAGPANVYNLTNKEHLINSKLIIPGNPGSSRIFIAIQAGTMPKGSPLSMAEQDVIRKFIMGAAGGDVNAPEPPPPTPEPKFNYIKTQIIGPKCASCHYQGSAKGGYTFDTYNGVLRAVNKLKPESSAIYKEARDGDMPPRPNPQLSSAELNLILDWIKKGAPND